MECRFTYGSIKSCKECEIESSCKYQRIFVDSNVFLAIILGEDKKMDPQQAEQSFEHHLVTSMLFTSHIVIGEIFQAIMKEYREDNNMDSARDTYLDNCDQAEKLLKSIHLLEADKGVLESASRLIREGDTDNRDRILISKAMEHKCTLFLTSDEALKEKLDGSDLVNGKIKITLFK